MRLGILGGNVYIDFLISGLVEFPAAFLILFTIERIGRRLPFATANIVAGVSCFITAFIPESKSQMTSEGTTKSQQDVIKSRSLNFLHFFDVFVLLGMFWFKTVVACIGRLGITMTFEMVVFVNTELYPTFVR